MGLFRLVLRLGIGALFVGHGTQKLFGWFGGGGIEETAGMLESLRLEPSRPNAVAVGVAEAGGGALLALGLATPLAAAALTGSMVTAIRTAHWKKGPWNTNGGYEYNLVLVLAVLALAETGPGPLSLDALRGRAGGGMLRGLGALALGAAGSVAAVALGHRVAARREASQRERNDDMSLPDTPLTHAA